MAVDLEEALVELAESLRFPAEGELAGRVLARLAEPEPEPAAGVVVALRRPWVRRTLAIAAAAILVVGVVLVASPRARRVAADLLGIGGVEIHTSSSTLPTTAPPTFPTTLQPDVLGLGDAVTPADGAARASASRPRCQRPSEPQRRRTTPPRRLRVAS